MYKALEEFLYLFFYMTEGYCLWLFYDNFLESRFCGRKWTGPVVVFSYAGIQKILNLLSLPAYEKPGAESLRIIGNMTMLFFFLLLSTAVFYKGSWRMTAFLFITFLSVHEIAYLFAATVWQRIYQFMISLASQYMEKGKLSPDGMIDFVYVSGYGMLFLTCITSVLLLYFVLKNLIQNFRDKEYNIHRKELFFLLTPGMIGLLVCILLRIIMFIVEPEKTTILYDRYPALVVIVSIILLLSLSAIPYSVKVFQGMIELHRERSDRVILENQISSMQGHMKEMEHIYAGIRSMKHDMQNTFSILMRLAAGAVGAGTETGVERSDINAELQNYLSEFQKAFEQLEFRYQTGNTVIDTLLNMKYHEICNTLPELKLDADRLLFPKSLYIQSYDMAVILGNALDNALEACKRLHEKEQEAGLFIRLSSFRKGNMFFLEVENSFDGELQQKEQSEFPITDKTDKEAHGMGLMNIKNAAEKYHGAADWSVEGRVFTLSVMMQNNRLPES